MKVLFSDKFFIKLISVALISVLNFSIAVGQTVTYPVKPIKILVGFAPGGAPDIIARLVGQKLSEGLGQPVIIENRPGATGNIAAQAVSKSDPDGYTLLLATVSIATSPAILGKLAVNPERELDPVGMVASVPLILIASPKSSINSVSDLIKFAKINPDKVNYASVGNGSPQQLAAELFQIMAGVKMTHIPYKGGAPATQAVLANEVDIFFAGMPPALPFVKSGQLKGLAVTSTKRSQAAPEIPTMQEAGLSNFDADNWNALYAPRGTSREIVNQLNKELNKVLQKSEVKTALEQQGAEPWPSTPIESKDYLAREIAKWAKVIKVSGVKSE